MKDRTKILVFIDWYVPAYKAGGPIRSVYNLVETLTDFYQFYIITSNGDIDNVKLQGIKTNEWTKQGSANILYLPSEEQSVKRYKKEVENIKPSKIYLNSMFSIKFTLFPIFAFKKTYNIVVAPRGMLGKESLAIKKNKKKIFLNISKKLKLYNNVVWHVSSIIEEKEVRKVFGKQAKVKISKNLTIVNKEFVSIYKNKNSINMITVGRVVSIKNIDYLLDELNSIETKIKIYLSIVGPIEDNNYYKKCLDIIKKHPSNIKVKFYGALPPIKLPKLYQNNHIYISPSLNENYGHSIAEAITYGRPVLISNNTPWQNLKKLNIGENLELEKGVFSKHITKFAKMNNEEFSKLQESTRKYALEHFNNKDNIKQSIEVFED